MNTNQVGAQAHSIIDNDNNVLVFRSKLRNWPWHREKMLRNIQASMCHDEIKQKKEQKLSALKAHS